MSFIFFGRESSPILGLEKDIGLSTMWLYQCVRFGFWDDLSCSVALWAFRNKLLAVFVDGWPGDVSL